MRKIIVFVMLLIISATSFSQPTTTPVPPFKTDYLKKSNNQKFLAWVLMGGGIAVVSITALSNVGLDFGSTEKSASPVAPLTIAGVLMVSSIPVFIASHKNKKKAMSLSLNNETAPQIQKNRFVNRSVPSLTLKISL